MTTVDHIADVDKLEQRFLYVDAAPDHGERNVRLGTFCYSPDLTPFTTLDPFSAEYREALLEAYNLLRGGWDYHLQTGELNPLDVDAFKKRPYPFLTDNNKMVGTISLRSE